MAKEIKDLSYVKSVTALADTLPEGFRKSSFRSPRWNSYIKAATAGC